MRDDKHNDNNRVLPAVLWALTCLLTSALLLLLALCYLHWPPAGDGARTAAPVGTVTSAAAEPGETIAGRRLRAIVGAGVVRGEGLLLNRYRARDGEFHAVVKVPVYLRAADYELLRYALDLPHPLPAVNLVWRLAADPARVHSRPLSYDPGGVSVLPLSGLPGWEGSIIELGLHIVVRDPAQEVSIGALQLQRGSALEQLRALLASWTAYRGWDQRSINFLWATVGGDGLSPVPLAAAWGGLALLLLLLLRLSAGALRRSQPAVAIALVLLVPWVALDLLWQRELSTQLAETRSLFAGKTPQQRHLADEDGWLYRYIARLQRSVLPARPATVYIVHHQVRWHNYERLKAQYYLLPHNVYNFALGPACERYRAGDYVLVLGETRDPSYDRGRQQLQWTRGCKLPARLLDSEERGSLYRVRAAVSRGEQGA